MAFGESVSTVIIGVTKASSTGAPAKSTSTTEYPTSSLTHIARWAASCPNSDFLMMTAQSRTRLRGSGSTRARGKPPRVLRWHSDPGTTGAGWSGGGNLRRGVHASRPQHRRSLAQLPVSGTPRSRPALSPAPQSVAVLQPASPWEMQLPPEAVVSQLHSSMVHVAKRRSLHVCNPLAGFG